MDQKQDITRRNFFKVALTSIFMAPFILRPNNSFAAMACPTVAPAGKPIASPLEGPGKALQYVTDAKMTKNPKFKAGSTCLTCKFYIANKAIDGYAPCTMLAMKYVNSCGWCTAFALKV